MPVAVVPVGGSDPRYPASMVLGRNTNPSSTGHSARSNEGTLWTKPQVDLSKLKANTLRRYVKTYHVRGVWLCSGKEELCRAVTAHFAQMPVDEGAVIVRLMERLRANKRRPKQL